MNQIWGHIQVRQSEEGKRAQLVQADTRYSVTAAKADQWVPIRPGTDGALALGLAHVIIQEGLYDEDLVQEHATGFLDWKDAAGHQHRGFRTLVLDDCPPERVAALTGVSAQPLFSLARRFATDRPALPLGERGPAFHTGDLYTRMAIHSLNALVGNIGREGGLLLQGRLPLSAWPALAQDKIARAGTAQPRIDRSNNPVPSTQADLAGLAANLASGEPYGLNLLFLYHTNPLFSLPKGQEWQRALERIPQVVSFSPFMDETTLHADLVLPDSTYLERWQDDEVSHLSGGLAVLRHGGGAGGAGAVGRGELHRAVQSGVGRDRDEHAGFLGLLHRQFRVLLGVALVAVPVFLFLLATFNYVFWGIRLGAREEHERPSSTGSR